tara:strand:+ start:232 stop:1335 length:1104 start_codon:yes stop_codon:yes gene_type:complete
MEGKQKNWKSVSPKTYFNERLFDDRITIKNNRKKSRKKIKDEDFDILKYKDYKVLLEKNFNVLQLKKMLKHYKQKVSGNKDEKIYRLWNYLKYSYFAVKLQSLYKGYILRRLIKLKGNGLKNREKCVNEWDCLSLQPLKEIPFDQFYSFNEEGFLYGFDLCSIYNLVKFNLTQQKKPKNPFTRKSFPSIVIEDMMKIILIGSTILKRNTTIFRDKDDQQLLPLRQKVKMKAIDIFQKIDNHGFITDVDWFMNLSRIRLGRFIKELKEVWNYRLNIPNDIKRKICPPHGRPFVDIDWVIFSANNVGSKDLMRKKVLMVLEKMLSGVDDDSKHLGSHYILGCLTLVNVNAATSMPWLFQSFMYQGPIIT